ncbi:MAG TPA: hypothetical protein VGK73_21685 [Polyangiaceae bacterium]
MSGRTSPLAPALLSLLLAGCSWSRFGDITENAPVEFLNRPSSMQTGFGVSLLAGGSEGSKRLLAGGEPGTSNVAMFDLGKGESPNLDALASNYCSGGAAGDCFLGFSVAYLPRTLFPEGRGEHTECVALGLGESPLEGAGVFIECRDGASVTRPVPSEYQEDVEFAFDVEQNEQIAIAGDGAEEPALLVGATHPRLAWYYLPGSTTPIRLVPPVIQGPSSGYGTTVAVVPLAASSWLFAVGAPSGDAVHLFRADEDVASYVGCLGGTPDFGRALAIGKVPGTETPEIGDAVADLVVSDRSTVYVFDGARLATLPPATGVSCTLAALPERTLLGSFGCGSTPETQECSSSDFGASLAVGDVDGDGDGEVLVGAPQMTVYGEHGVGAVLIYDVERLGDGELSDLRFIASGEPGDALGGSVAAVSIGDRDLIVGGLPRAGKVGLFYCSSLVPGEKRGSRCE